LRRFGLGMQAASRVVELAHQDDDAVISSSPSHPGRLDGLSIPSFVQLPIDQAADGRHIPLQRAHPNVAAAGLKTSDGRLRRPHPRGDFRLGQAERFATGNQRRDELFPPPRHLAEARKDWKLSRSFALGLSVHIANAIAFLIYLCKRRPAEARVRD